MTSIEPILQLLWSFCPPLPDTLLARVVLIATFGRIGLSSGGVQTCSFYGFTMHTKASGALRWPGLLSLEGFRKMNGTEAGSITVSFTATADEFARYAAAMKRRRSRPDHF